MMSYVMLSMVGDDYFELTTIPCGEFISAFLSRFVGSGIEAIQAITSVFAVDLSGLSLENPVLPLVAQNEVYFSGLPTIITTCFGKYYLESFSPAMFEVGVGTVMDAPVVRCRWKYRSTYSKEYDDFLYDIQTTPDQVDNRVQYVSDYNAPANPFQYSKHLAIVYTRGPAPGVFTLIIPVWAYPYHTLWGPVSLDGFEIPTYQTPVDPWSLNYVLTLPMPVDSGQYRGANPLYGPPEIAAYTQSYYYQYTSGSDFYVTCSAWRVVPRKTQYIRPTHTVMSPPYLLNNGFVLSGQESDSNFLIDNLMGIRIVS